MLPADLPNAIRARVARLNAIASELEDMSAYFERRHTELAHRGRREKWGYEALEWLPTLPPITVEIQRAQHLVESAAAHATYSIEAYND